MLVTLIIIAASALLAFRLTVSTDISVLMPANSRVSGALLEAFEDFGTTDRLVVIVESKRDGGGDVIESRRSIKALGGSLAGRMERTGLFTSVAYRITPEQREFFEDLYFGRPFHYHSPETLASLESKLEPEAIERRVAELRRTLAASPFGATQKRRLLLDPLGFRSGSGSDLEHENLAGFRLDLSDGHFFSIDGTALVILARPRSPSQDVAFDAKLLGELERILGDLGGSGTLGDDYSMSVGAGLEVHLLGPYVETLYGTRAARREILPSFVMTWVGLIVLFSAVHRSLETLLLLAIPLLAGIAVTFGIASVLTGHLTVVTVGFAAMLAGLGVDFGIHLVERVGEESRSGATLRESISRAFTTTGRGVLAGALTSAAIFMLIATSDFGALREFGLIVGLGVLATLVSMVFLLPASIVTFARPRDGSRSELGLPRSRLRMPGVSWILAHHRLVSLLGLALTLAMAYSASRLEFERNVYELGPTNPGHEKTRDRLLEKSGGSTNVVMAIVEHERLQELLETTEEIAAFLEELRSRGEIDSFESLSSVLRPRRSQQEAVDVVRGWDLAGSMSAFRQALGEADFRTAPFEPFIENVLSYRSGAGPYVDLEDLRGAPADDQVGRFLVRDGERWKSITYIYPRVGSWEEEVPAEIVGGLERLERGVVLTGVVPSFNEITTLVRREFQKLTWAAVVFVFLISLAFFGRPRISVLAMVPAAIGLVWTLGLMKLAGIELNLVTILVAPLIVGLGIDDAVHLLNRHREEPDALSTATVSVSGAILMTSATTIIAFGSLSFADLPSLAALGATVSIGMLCCAVTSLVLLPALIAALAARR